VSPLIEVRDADDARLAPYRDLKARARGGPREDVVVESEVCVGRLLASGLPVESVVTTPARLGRVAGRVPAGTPLYVAPAAVLRDVVGLDLHRTCLALARRPAPAPLPDAALAAREVATVVVTAGLADPVNLGAIARTCRAFGVDLLVADPAGADPFAPRAVRASMGHVFTQRLAVAPPGEALAALRTGLPGLRALAATTSPGATPLPDVARPARLALLVGHEGSGLPADLVRAADGEVTIPIDPAADSLNAAAAAAVLLYALRPPEPAP